MKRETARFKVSVIALAVIVAAAIPQALRSQEASFSFRKPEIGDQRRMSTNMKMAIKLHVDMGEESQEMEISTTVEERKLEKVLAVEEGRPSALRVVYEKFDRVQEGAEDAPLKPVIDKPYVVEQGDSTVEVRAEDGGQLYSEERQFLTGEYDELQEDEHFGRMLEGKKLRVGDSVPVDEELASSFFRNLPASSDGDIKEFTITLRELRPVAGVQHAVFDMKLEAMFETSPVALQLSLKGELIIATATCRPAKITMSGPLDMIVTDESMSLTAEGSLEISSEAEYLK